MVCKLSIEVVFYSPPPLLPPLPRGVCGTAVFERRFNCKFQRDKQQWRSPSPESERETKSDKRKTFWLSNLILNKHPKFHWQLLEGHHHIMGSSSSTIRRGSYWQPMYHIKTNSIKYLFEQGLQKRGRRRRRLEVGGQEDEKRKATEKWKVKSNTKKLKCLEAPPPPPPHRDRRGMPCFFFSLKKLYIWGFHFAQTKSSISHAPFPPSSLSLSLSFPSPPVAGCQKGFGWSETLVCSLFFAAAWRRFLKGL